MLGGGVVTSGYSAVRVKPLNEVQADHQERRIALKKQFPGHILEVINHFLFTADTGTLSLTIQDGYVVKIEKAEKYIITAKTKDKSYVKYSKPLEVHPLQGKIIEQMQEIEYGQMVIRVTNGRVEHIEKTEKRRVNNFEGIDGDGI